mgnify:FL=1
MKVDETRFEIGDIITGTSVSGTVYSITNELASLEVVGIRGDRIRVELKYHPHFKEEIGEIFFVDPSLFKKEETRFTNFRR